MNDTQLYLSIGIPTFAVILAWLSNRTDINRLNDKVDNQGASLRAEMQAMRTEMTAIRNDHHRDNLALMSYMVPLHERMAKLETRN